MIATESTAAASSVHHRSIPCARRFDGSRVRPHPGCPRRQKTEPHWLLGVAGAWMIIYLPTFMVVHLMAVRPTVSAPKSVTFSLVEQ